jgi:hypothetical protein
MRAAAVHEWFVLLLIFLSGAALSGCDVSSEVTAAPPLSIELSPAGPIDLGVGDTLRVIANLTGGGRTAQATFASSDSSVARVDPGGLVTAVAPGRATISATAIGDPNIRAGVLVRVFEPLSVPPSSRAPSVVIESIVGADNRPLDRDSVGGTAFVRLAVERGNAARFEVLLDSTTACVQSFVAPSGARAGPVLARSAVTLVCPINTARFDTLSGVPTFPNRRYTLVARLVGPGGSAVASAGGVAVTLRNADRLIARLDASRAALDVRGREWVGGDLSVSALPVIYSPDSRVRRASFRVELPGRPELVATDSVPPFAVVLREEADLRGVLADSLVVLVRSVLQGGALGPTATTGPVRYDDEAPVPGTLRPREWLGKDTRLIDLYDSRQQSDAGVGEVEIRFLAGDSAASDADLLARGNRVAVGSDLAESAARAYRVTALVCDALQNCASRPGFVFGVDLTAPRIAGLSLPDRAVNPEGDLSLLLADDLSGLDFRPVEATVTRRTGNTAGICGPVVDGVDLPGTLRDGACAPDTVTSALPVPESAAGYYSYTLVALDRAGNRSAPVRREILVDRTPPEIVSLEVPARFTGGADARFTARVRDNLSLVHAAFRLVFPQPGSSDRLAVPFSGGVVLGAPFEPPLVSVATVADSFPFVRTMTYPSGGAAPAAGQTVWVDSVQLRVRDAAGAAARLSRPIPRAAIDSAGAATAPFRNVHSLVPTLNNSVLCLSSCLPSDVTSATFTLRVSGGSGMRNPFDRVLLFSRGADGAVRLQGTARSASLDETGESRTFTYSIPLTPASLVVGELRVFAIGVNSAGDAFKSGEVTVGIFSR